MQTTEELYYSREIRLMIVTINQQIPKLVTGNMVTIFLGILRSIVIFFEMAVNRALNKNIDVDWSDVRVICIAPGYKKYDLYAVQMMGANIELWQYKLYENGTLYLEEIFRRSTINLLTEAVQQGKNPIMVEAGKKLLKQD